MASFGRGLIQYSAVIPSAGAARATCRCDSLRVISRGFCGTHFIQQETIMTSTFATTLVGFTLAAAASGAFAQTPAYGAPISLDAARRCIAAAEAESRKNNWTMAIAVLDGGGHNVASIRMDGTQFGSANVAHQKAFSAIAYRRPTKAFEDVLAKGGDGLRILRLDGAIPVEGGVPIVMDGRMVGAIGASGGTAQQDGVVAKACTDVLK
jgi:glc operon protein GlcG